MTAGGERRTSTATWCCRSARGEPREVLEGGRATVWARVNARTGRCLWSRCAMTGSCAGPPTRRSPTHVSEYCGAHLNDMVVDSHGRAYVGNFGFDPIGGGDPAPANLMRVDPGRRRVDRAKDLLFPNGSVITPDGATLIVGEGAGARYTPSRSRRTAR
jgi:hypothetical protein